MLRSAVYLLRTWERLGITPTFPSLGPFPVADQIGFSVAISMVIKSYDDEWVNLMMRAKVWDSFIHG
jgi:hypothetical protein